MDNLYKQGASLITYQEKGFSVEWGIFINAIKDQYLTTLLQKWARFFTKIDKTAAM